MPQTSGRDLKQGLCSAGALHPQHQRARSLQSIARETRSYSATAPV